MDLYVIGKTSFNNCVFAVNDMLGKIIPSHVFGLQTISIVHD